MNAHWWDTCDGVNSEIDQPVDDLDGTRSALTPKARGMWPLGVVRRSMLSAYPNSAPRMPMTLRKMMIPTMTTAIKRKIRNQKQPL
jgi:hypothetical protein